MRSDEITLERLRKRNQKNPALIFMSTPINNIRTFIVSTAPRVGSMWLFNAVRLTLRAHGFGVFPDEVPPGDHESLALHDQSLKLQDGQWKLVIKVHQMFSKIPPECFILSSIRDPRDAVVSYMEFTDKTFNESKWLALDIKNFYEQYSSLGGVHMVSYAQIEEYPEDVIFNFQKEIGLIPSVSIAKEVADQLAHDKVKIFTKELAEKKISSFHEIPQPHNLIIVGENHRVYDVNTGFQSGHVNKSGRKTGGWRSVLSEGEAREIEDLVGRAWLTKLGFPL